MNDFNQPTLIESIQSHRYWTCRVEECATHVKLYVMMTVVNL